MSIRNLEEIDQQLIRENEKNKNLKRELAEQLKWTVSFGF